MNLPELVSIVAPGEGDNHGHQYWIVDAFAAVAHKAYPSIYRPLTVYAYCDDRREAETIRSVHNRTADPLTLREFEAYLFDLEGEIGSQLTKGDLALVS